VVSLAVAHSRALRGLSAPAVRVEVHLGTGLPNFSIVGLPEAAVRESRERVRAALIESGFDFPNRRITVNLAPADLPKDSARFDLPIAVGILAASGALPPAALDTVELVGELSLGGALRPIRGALALAAGFAAEAGNRALVVPRENAPEAALSGHAAILGAGTLQEVCGHLQSQRVLEAVPPAREDVHPAGPDAERIPAADVPDLADVVGQLQARRALEIAAAGRHHLLMTGPPGTGKSLLSQRLPGLLPRPSRAEALTAAAVASLRDRVDPALWMRRPFRSPHHSVSVAGLIGGGQPPRPGEISLAHEGVLFLDELPEFRRAALEALREPLETGQVTIARGARSETFPAGFLLVAAMNPCPCGYQGDAVRCRCTPQQLRRYRARLSGPLLDRFDLCVDVRRETAVPAAGPVNEASAPVARRVAAARERQSGRQGRCNGDLLSRDLQRHLHLVPAASDLAARAAVRFGWSMRALHRALKVARTIADLAGRDETVADDVAEAIALRRGLESWSAAVDSASLPAECWDRAA
jgi:magnesium chelatase family protein